MPILALTDSVTEMSTFLSSIVLDKFLNFCSGERTYTQ